MPVWCPAKVVEKKVWTDGLFTLRLNAPQVEPFEPGQFLHLAIQDGDKTINRPYSVASPHGDTLDFFIVVVPEGELTPRLWTLNPGDSIQIGQRAAGGFTLSKTPTAEVLWLLSTGTGLAPYIAMLRETTIWDRYQKIVVVHGARFARDFGYAEELSQLQRENPSKLKYVPAMTREKCQGTLFGRLTSCLEDGSLEQAADAQLRPENSAVMLCGNPDMLDQMEAMLIARGLKRHRSKNPGHIVTERYW